MSQPQTWRRKNDLNVQHGLICVFVCVCVGPALGHGPLLLADCWNAFTTNSRHTHTLLDVHIHVLTYLQRTHRFRHVHWGKDRINTKARLHLSNAFVLLLMYMCHKTLPS